MKTEDIRKMAQAWNAVQEASKKKMDPVDQDELKGTHAQRKDKDIDNDGDADASDEYLHNRRKAVSKAMKKDDAVTMNPKAEAKIDEISNKTLTNYAKTSYNDILKRRANRPAGQGDESDPKIGKRLAMNKLAHKKGAFKEEADWPIYNRILESRAMHYKGAAPADPMDKGQSPGGKKMKKDIDIDTSGKISNYDDLGHDDASKAGRITKKAPGRTNDRSEGDKNVVNPVKDTTK